MLKHSINGMAICKWMGNSNEQKYYRILEKDIPRTRCDDPQMQK